MTCSEAWSTCSATCSETDFRSFEADWSQPRAEALPPPCRRQASAACSCGCSLAGVRLHAIVDDAKHEHRRIVDAHLPLLPQPDDARSPVVFRHLPEVAPDGRVAVFVAAHGPFGHGVGAKDQLVARITHLVENCELQQVVALQIDAAQHDRIGLELWRNSPAETIAPVRRRGSGRGNCRPGRRPPGGSRRRPRPGRRRPRRRGRRARWRRPPSAASPSGTRPGCWYRCWRPNAARCRCSQAANSSGSPGLGLSATTASARMAAQGPENRADDTPSAIAAMWCSVSTQQASW